MVDFCSDRDQFSTAAQPSIDLLFFAASSFITRQLNILLNCTCGDARLKLEVIDLKMWKIYSTLFSLFGNGGETIFSFNSHRREENQL